MRQKWGPLAIISTAWDLGPLRTGAGRVPFKYKYGEIDGTIAGLSVYCICLYTYIYIYVYIYIFYIHVCVYIYIYSIYMYIYIYILYTCIIYR